MGLLLFTGVTLIGFSFPAVLFVLLVAKRAQLIIVTITAAFFWILATFFTALLWFLIPALKLVPWAVIIINVVAQEVIRYVFYRLYAKVERSFTVVSTNAISFPLTDFYSATAAGLGFGLMYCVLMYGTIASNSLGPGTLFADTCPHFSTFVNIAWSSLLFGILHVLLMIIAFEGYRGDKRVLIVAVIFIHLAADVLIMINEFPWYGCLIYLPTLFLFTILAGVITHLVISQPSYRSKRHIA